MDMVKVLYALDMVGHSIYISHTALDYNADDITLYLKDDAL